MHIPIDPGTRVGPYELTALQERVARFLARGPGAASLNHPNIAHVYALEEVDGSKALVMELVERPALADSIALT